MGTESRTLPFTSQRKYYIPTRSECLDRRLGCRSESDFRTTGYSVLERVLGIFGVGEMKVGEVDDEVSSSLREASTDAMFPLLMDNWMKYKS